MRMYTNPLPIAVSDQDQGIAGLPATVNPDPYVLKYNGEYYAYATSGEGVAVLHSKDMVNWEHLGYAYRQAGQRDYWAPAVHYDNGLFYLYVSTRAEEEEDVHYEFLQVAVSGRPEGPYVHRKTLFDTFSIDAHVVRDTDGGLVLFYSTNETCGIDAHRPGTVILADRLLDPFTPEGKPKLIVKPTLDEEIYERNRFGDGRDWHTIEGAFHLQRRGKHYVMYSGNAFTSPYYYIGYSAADHRNGASMTELEWRKFPGDDRYEPLLRQNERVEGVGHNSVVKAPNNMDDWVVYHGRDAFASGIGERRQMRIDPLWWLGERMYVPGPSYETQPAPAMPDFRDLFDRPDADDIGAAWETIGGEWSIRNGELVQRSRSGVSHAMTPRTYDCAVFEANVKWERHHTGGLYGAVVHYADEANFVEVLLDAGKRTIGVYETAGGIRLEPFIVQVSLKAGSFLFDAYHQILIHVAGRNLRVMLDGIELMVHDCRASSGRVGLATHYTSARFDGIAVTGNLSWEWAGAAACTEYLAPREGHWLADGSRLVGIPQGGAASIAIRRPFADQASTCRFDLIGDLASLRLKLESGEDAEGERASLNVPSMSDLRACTIRIRYEEGRLEAWADRVQAVSGLAIDDWERIAIASDRELAIEMLEWTAFGS